MNDSEFDDFDAELVPSELDEASHAELRMLYRDAANAILFAKALQWKTLGATLLIFLVLVLAGRFVRPDELFVKVLVVSAMVLAGAAIYTLCIYQAWQGTERDKQSKIARSFSSLTREILAIKVASEANVHRYILLAFMAVSILFGCAVLYLVLSPLYH